MTNLTLHVDKFLSTVLTTAPNYAFFLRRPLTEPWREGEAPNMARQNWPQCGIADPGESPRAADLAFTQMADPANRRCDPVSAAQRPLANMYCNHVFKIAINTKLKNQ